eukprot:TRINITY_DN535_c0_g1_i4.p1 TRINITY_DN535_c0_g1~~TRINITY_DN535_c0_g1_i4.p1  ORF type:complete len:719 (+),score=238.40 TRINITY_DN535_c0_g1_i4:317-2158(+)
MAAAAGRAAGAAVRPPTVVPNAQRPGVQQQPRPQPQPAAHAARGGPVQTVPQKQPVADVTLPFNIKTRRVADLRVRHLHRRHLPDNLLRAQAHWISTEPGTMAWVKNHTKAEQITKEHVPYEAPGEGELQARCLFVTGVATGEPARHIVKRVEVVASNAAAAPGAPGPKQHLQAYGGAVTAKADAQQRKQLVELVKKQCGVELEPSKLMRFVEFEYRDGRKTVFYIPTDLGESVHLMCQCEEEEEEYEAEEEVVDEEADAKAAAEWEAKREEREAELQKKREEAEAAAALEGKEGTAEVKAPERKQVMKKVKVTKTRTKTHRKVQPMKMPLGNLLEYSVTSGMHINTVELAMAADALDEFFKREMATRMWAHLEKVGKVKSEELAAAKVKQEKIQEIKRKRQEEDEARKKRRTEKEDEKKAVWAVEDEGKTDDEKKGLAKARAKELADLWKDEDEELKAKRAAPIAACTSKRSTAPTSTAPLRPSASWGILRAPWPPRATPRPPRCRGSGCRGVPAQRGVERHRHRLAPGWRCGGAVHGPFAEQCARAPDRVALSFALENITCGARTKSCSSISAPTWPSWPTSCALAWRPSGGSRSTKRPRSAARSSSSGLC